MSTIVDGYLKRFPIAAAILYVGVVVVFVFATWTNLVDLSDRNEAVATASDLAAKLERRNGPPSQPSGPGDGSGSTGSPFLEGATVTVAGAALLQRVAAAVTRVGGNVLSSQVDVQGTQAKAGFVSVVASCELDQPALQRLLYDIEAGFPFLFVDQLVVQAPTSSTAPGGRLRLVLGVSGQWQGAK